ncbi:MAG: hypothetical protein J4G04_08545, partial [Nitrosopumilaceae archaeon]|nr:hypothetical protein [Nitrosopumilaceae archaeon]
MRAIEEVRGQIYPGNGRQDQYRDSPVWYTKHDLDIMVAGRLNLDADALLGLERKSCGFSDHITRIISELRHKEMLQDWNAGRRFGIWRVTDTAGLAEYGPGGREPGLSKNLRQKEHKPGSTRLSRPNPCPKPGELREGLGRLGGL